jgi:two-component system NtrC family sensor kinase
VAISKRSYSTASARTRSSRACCCILESSGEHRSTDINDLVDESLNRAYYNAQAEQRGFTIKLERFFDPTVGEADLYPREITRALLNLISNGFYAATKRKAEAKGNDHEPTVTAATKNLGDHVEIRILRRTLVEIGTKRHFAAP